MDGITAWVHQTLRDQGYLALEPGKGRNMHIRLTQTGRRIVQQVVLPVKLLTKRMNLM